MFENIKKIADEIKTGLEDAKWEAIDNNLSTMADANVYRIERGQNVEGKALGYYKSEPYARLKKSMGSASPFGTYDFKFSGNFLSGIFAKRNNKTIIFGSTDEKTQHLESLAKDNGGTLFGLQEEQRTDIANGQIIPEIWDWVKTKMQRL